jgi:hypothetical protein
MTVIASTSDESVDPPLILKNSSRPHPLILSLSKSAVAISAGES